MAETQRDIRVADDSIEPVESPDQAPGSSATVARMLANPRRVRRT